MEKKNKSREGKILNSLSNEQESNISDGRSQEELGSRNKVRSREQEASTFIAGRIEAARKKQQGQISKHEAEDIERGAAYDYAKRKNIWVHDLYSLGDPLKGGGNENTLAYDEINGIIYKSNNLFNYQNSISKFLDGIQAHNKLFPETKYDLVGFTGLEKGGGEIPYVEPILKQDYIPNTEQTFQEEIDTFMKSLGFEKTNNHTFRNDQYTISDLRPRNVLKDKLGNIYVVDNVINEN